MNLYPKNPAEEIEEALNTLDLAARLQIGFRENYINSLCFTSNIGINRDTGSHLRTNQNKTILKNRFINLVFSTLATAACAIDRALDNKFGKKDSKDRSEIGALRNIFYMIRCAFAHDPCNPQWCCKGAYCESPYSITISKILSSRVVFREGEAENIAFELDFNQINNQRLDFTHFEGLDGFFLLAEYAKKQVE